MHKSWQMRTVLLTWSTIIFCCEKFQQYATDFVFFMDKKVFSVTSPNNRQNKVSGRLWELLRKKLNFFFTSVRALLLPGCLLTVSVSCNFSNSFVNTMLCPAFLRKFVCQPLCCVPLQIQTFYQNLVITMLIVDKHCSDVCCDEFPMPQIDAKVDRYKNSDMENFIWNQYGERFAILDTENIKICRWITKLEAISLRFLQYMQNIWFIISQGSVATCLRW